MGKVRVHEFNPQIYPRLLWIAVTKESKIENFDDLSDMDDSYMAVVDNTRNNETDKGGIMIRFSSVDDMTYENIAHESAHAAMEMISYIEGKLDLNNQEFLCYLLGWIAKCCAEVREKELNYGKETDHRAEALL